jgi:hypothetical protein
MTASDHAHQSLTFSLARKGTSTDGKAVTHTGFLHGMTAAVSDETDDEGRGVPGMKQSHEFRTRERATRTIGGERGWLRPNFIAVDRDETERSHSTAPKSGECQLKT